ncbi:MAG: homoserine dehydrogenase [Synergistota bacterium]|nr:homoserine dehydrogenase [Synergistota bacterium]
MWKICCVGFGNVGQGLVRILEKKRDKLKDTEGFEYIVTSIADPVKGSVHNTAGLDLTATLKLLDEEGSLKNHPDATERETLDIIADPASDLVVEATITNLETGEPGVSHISRALASGKHVVSTNKGPVSVALPKLLDLAKANGVSYMFEGVVLSGTPAMNLARDALAGCDITQVQGIVNGTTNYILSRMEDGMAYGEALKKAQELGYAEADPTGDVEGWDAAVKVQVMAKVLMNRPLQVTEVERTGITDITPADVEKAKAAGARIKLIAKVGEENGKFTARVAPMEMPLNHPLAGVMDAVNALTFTTDHLGDVTIVGPGAGRVETGQALLTDILAINRKYG